MVGRLSPPSEIGEAGLCCISALVDEWKVLILGGGAVTFRSNGRGGTLSEVTSKVGNVTKTGTGAKTFFGVNTGSLDVKDVTVSDATKVNAGVRSHSKAEH